MSQKNYLVIGLGGTGCVVVRELKKKMYVEWRKKNSGSYPDVYRFKDDFGGEEVESRVATLSIDSNAGDLDGEGEKDKSWTVFGETLRLRDTEKVLLDPSGTAGLLSNLDSYPGVSPWIKPDLEFVNEITRGQSGPAGCDQIRRMGRLAFANGNGVDNVLSAVSNRLSALTEGGGFKDAEIHIACTLGCGTGSGTVIDILTQIQKKMIAHDGEVKVHLHTFATSSDVGSVNTGNFYANQYAALQELNAFSLGNYHPWDVNVGSGQSGQRLSVEGSGSSSLSQIKGTFNSCALITDTTEGGRQVGLNDQVENVAEVLYQIAVGQMGNLPVSFRKGLTCEDRKQYPADSQGGDRSTKFCSYGVQKLAIPEKEIKEKLAFTMGRQFLLGRIYNNYDRRYLDKTASNFGVDSFVQKRRETWKSSSSSLNLDFQEKLDAEDQHAPFKDDWRNRLTKIEAQVRTTLSAGKGDRKKWLKDFDRRAKDYWGEGFRGRGVEDYFSVKSQQQSVREHASYIRQAVEKDLVDGFERMDAKYVVHYFPEIADCLVKEIERERIEFSEHVESERKKLEQKDDEREKVAVEYGKIGLFGGNKVDRLFALYNTLSVQYYMHKTRALAAQYAVKLTNELLLQLKELRKDVTDFVTRLKLLGNDFETEIHLRINEDQVKSKDEDVVYMVDSDKVNSSIDEDFVASESIQNKLADEVMKALIRQRGENKQFSSYNKNLMVDDKNHVTGSIVTTLRRVVEEETTASHVDLKENDKDFQGIFGQNILENLYQDNGGIVGGELREQFKQLINDAMPMLAFDGNAELMEVPESGPVIRRCIILPKWEKCPTNEAGDPFDEQLEHMLKDIKGGSGSSKKVEVEVARTPEKRNPTEIVIMTTAFFFPLRMTQVLTGLKRKYLERTMVMDDTAAARARFQVHTESHNPPLPDLMKLGQEEIRKQKLPSVLLALALELDHVSPDGEILFGNLDNVGRLKDRVDPKTSVTHDNVRISKSSAEKLGMEIEPVVVALVDHYLKDFNDKCIADLDKLLLNKVREGVAVDEVSGILDDLSAKAFLLRGKSESDEIYNLFNDKVESAKEMLGRLDKY
ncbi:MAG: tubulin-like doman-containing protein [Rubritalea sp.]|uniref:tubulin-like doman-containing protein n=1 Tax=Rubritalea sp. TaxID=2109375 RepID=UPI00324284BC